MLDSPMPLPPSVTPAWKHMRNKKAQIISSSIRNKTPGKRGSLFAKWGWTGAITEPVLLPAQERCRIKLGGHGSVSGCLAVATQPWVLHPSSCRILLLHPAAPSCCPILLLHPALLGVCVQGSGSRAVPSCAEALAAVPVGWARPRRQGFVFKAASEGRTPSSYPPFIFLLL